MSADPELVYENAAGSLWFHPDERIVHHKFKKFIFGADFRAVLGTGAEVMETRGGTKWLSDDRMNPALHPDDHAWAETVWYTRVKSAGWTHWALVLPVKIIGKMAMKRIVEQYRERGITVELFAEPDKALRWLKTQP